tara:strand:+ start:38 stop:385 length:348 start_codon:yes stop_codon:yes gene_type:complete
MTRLFQRRSILSEEVWSVIKYKPKEGCEEEFLEALKRLKQMMKDNKNYEHVNDFIKIDNTGEYVQIARMPSIDALVEGQVDGLEWLDSVDHLLERYENDSRTNAFSGINIPIDID